MSRVGAALASLVLIASGGIAAAQGLGDPRSVYDWSGFYLGVQGGWGWADQHLDDGVALDGEVALNGGFFGPIAGFQKQWNSWVLGAEIEASWSDVDGQDTLAGAPGRTFGKVEIFGSVGPKVGFAWGRALLYGTAGLAGAETGSLQRNGAAATEDDDMSFGWMAGAGIDYAITPQIIAGIRYRHYDFGEADYIMGFVPDRSGETDMDTVSGHVSFKLGGSSQ